MVKHKILKSTHEGKITIGENELNVAVLEDGTRLITQSAIFKAFGRTKRGRALDDVRVLNRPAFIDAKNLQPFIDEGLDSVLNTITYNSINNNPTEGYNAEILPKLCKVYLDARADGKLVTQQLPLARASEILLIALSKIGITALVDEATGYQYERERDELQIILKAYISEELLAWQQRFPHEFYKQIFRLNNWEYTVQNLKSRPGVVGTWTNKYVYKQLPNGVLEELKKETPKTESGKFKEHLHRRLTQDVGHPHLDRQITSVITIMKLSKSWRDFNKKFNELYGQQEIDFDDE